MKYLVFATLIFAGSNLFAKNLSELGSGDISISILNHKTIAELQSTEGLPFMISGDYVDLKEQSDDELKEIRENDVLCKVMFHEASLKKLEDYSEFTLNSKPKRSFKKGRAHVSAQFLSTGSKPIEMVLGCTKKATRLSKKAPEMFFTLEEIQDAFGSTLSIR